jgi:HlyD family secretion protein
MTISRTSTTLLGGTRALASSLLILQVPLAIAAAQPDAGLTVSTAIAQHAERPLLLEAAGRITPWEEAVIDAQDSGLTVLEAPARVGDRVKKGQLLVRFDDASVQAELAAAQAALLQARTAADEARADWDRAARLEDTGALSAQDILKTKTHAASTEAQVAGAQAALRAVRLRLERTRLFAPDAGVISSRTVSLGAVASAGTELFRLIRQERLEWRAELPGSELIKTKPGLTVTLSLPQGPTVRGRARELGPSLDPTTQLGILYADLEPSTEARAGMYAKGTIELGRREVVLVPSESIVTREGRSYAVTLEVDHARLLPVTTGVRGPAVTEVLSGVASGVTLITRGAGFLSDGTRVRVAPVATARSEH